MLKTSWTPRKEFDLKHQGAFGMLLDHDSNSLRGLESNTRHVLHCVHGQGFETPCLTKTLPKRCFGHNKLPCCLRAPKEVFLLEIGEF